MDVETHQTGGVIVRVRKPKSAKWKLERFMKVYVGENGEIWAFKKIRRPYHHIGSIYEVLNDNECIISISRGKYE